MADSEPTLIEVGASRGDGTIRYWWAKEAVRQGEMRLAAQSQAIDQLRARAGWLLGWCTTLALALVGAAGAGRFESSALVSALAVFAAGVCCVFVLWPLGWQVAGHGSAWALTEPYPTELEGMESFAKGYCEDDAINAAKLRRAAAMMRTALGLFAGAPLVGAVVLGLTAL